MKRKSLVTAGLSLACMLSVSMALAGNASAGTLWLLCKKGSGLTKYVSDRCGEAKSSGEWQLTGLTSGEKTTIAIQPLTLTLIDEKTSVGKAEVRCDTGTEEEGTIESPNKAEIKNVKVSSAAKNCRALEGACKAEGIEVVEGVNQPWKTELYETEKSVEGHFSGTGEEPGWKVKCSTSLGHEEDVCKQVAGQAEHFSLESFGLPDFLIERWEYLDRSKMACSQAENKEAGIVRLAGTFAVGAFLGVSPS